MRKFLKFDDGQEVELSPISYSEFLAIDCWVGASDTAFKDWLRHNGYVEADDYREEALREASLRITLSPTPRDRFEFSDDGGETWKELDTFTHYSGYCHHLKSED